MDQGTISVVTDNEAIWKMVNRLLQVANQLNQDIAAEAIAMKRLIKQVIITIILDKVEAYKKLKTMFH